MRNQIIITDLKYELNRVPSFQLQFLSNICLSCLELDKAALNSF